MRNTHTPGPWINRIAGVISAYGSVDTISAAVLIPVAICQPLQDHDSDGREYTLPGDLEANARLVTAAPDMLAVLRKARRYFYDMGGERPHSEDQPIVAEIEAVITQVENGK